MGTNFVEAEHPRGEGGQFSEKNTMQRPQTLPDEDTADILELHGTWKRQPSPSVGNTITPLAGDIYDPVFRDEVVYKNTQGDTITVMHERSSLVKEGEPDPTEYSVTYQSGDTTVWSSSPTPERVDSRLLAQSAHDVSTRVDDFIRQQSAYYPRITQVRYELGSDIVRLRHADMVKRPALFRVKARRDWERAREMAVADENNGLRFKRGEALHRAVSQMD